MDRGLIHIYCGDGKGKTTAAIGLAARCAGAGGRVLFFQFLKGNSSSERKILKEIKNIDLVDGIDNMKFVWNMTDTEKAEAARKYKKIFEDIADRAADYDMIILDEVIPALKYDFVSEHKLVDFLKSKPDGTEIVLTGREPSNGLMELADYVTKMKKIKHPFDDNIKARLGIEY
ncbi:MAG: cob(I)yrinic acid a,c-diamide adenosyltransferase [Oscillospiraceae bacterium]|nr:cob(I)yrinic acid a,c-diamide adenosyltransferase [Oscillospiraceae bacterium]